ncbi:hypothetical protein [Streptomyces sp. NPDC101393]|uniref:hypothetical protein n=1 Tax=Streptomyces sp. NPDC101393 TaxID=3366141 RepID=UPI003821F6B0
MRDHAGHDVVRRSYDAVAEEYAARLHDELAGKPLDRALLGRLLEEGRTVPRSPTSAAGRDT